MTSYGFDLTAITADRLREAALTFGMQQIDTFAQDVIAFAPQSGDEWDLLDAITVPRSSDHPSFVRLAEDAIEQLSRITGFGLRDIFTIVATGNTDVFKVRATDLASGTVPLNAFSKMAKRVEQVMRELANASFAELAIRQQERVTRSIQERFFGALLAGQTEIGSYVVTVHSPLGRLHVAEDQLDVGIGELPLARSVNLAMSRQLVDLSSELENVRHGRQGLEEAVMASQDRTGVLADTCLRLSEMIAEVESGFEIALMPSPAIALPPDAPSLRATFDAPQAPLLEEAARLLTPPVEDSRHFRLKGIVTDTHQDAGPDRGDTYVKIRGVVMEGPGRNSFRTVRVQVDARQLAEAVDAFHRRHVVIVEGDLVDPDARHWATSGTVSLHPVADERWEDILPRPE